MTPCRNCKSETFTHKRVWIENGELQDMCSECGFFTPTTVPDVFFKHPYKSEALDVEFTSKGQKAAYLKSRGIREAGDERMDTKSWVEGSRDYRKRQFDKNDRPRIRKTIGEWRQRVSR